MLLTLGYGSYTQTSFIEALRSLGVQTLVDVRESPRSRKPGFAGRALDRRLAEHGIAYVHVRELGAPPALREELRRCGDHAAFLAAYDRHLDAQEDAVSRLADLAREATVAAMCLETDPARCHRSILAARVRGRWPELEVVVH
jgi:uncharacterized protein (DUF488 family)